MAIEPGVVMTVPSGVGATATCNTYYLCSAGGEDNRIDGVRVC